MWRQQFKSGHQHFSIYYSTIILLLDNILSAILPASLNVPQIHYIPDLLPRSLGCGKSNVTLFFLVSRGGVRLSPLGTSATNSPIVPAPDERWWWVCSSRWNENWQGKPKYSEKTCPSATLFTTNPTWHDLGSNPGRRYGKPATKCLSYGTANVRLSPLVLCSQMGHLYQNMTVRMWV
jgi:hypothetical protein